MQKLFIQVEEQAHAELFLRRLERALNCLTPIQANRVYAHFFLGRRYIEIARDEGITPKKWTAEKNRLTAYKNVLYEKMKSMREDIKAVEQIRKNAEQLAKADTTKSKTDKER